MARPVKHNADYFPHNNDMRNDRRCKALRSKFNLEGYAVFVMLLETLTGANHFQIEDNKMELELIAGDIDIDSKKLNAILEYLIKLGLLVKAGDLISSPILNDLKDILSDLRSKDRKRKTNSSENPIKENSTKENEVFHAENTVFQLENTQSKVKQIKVNKRKVNKIKEKGNSENLPPIFLNNFSFSEKVNTTQQQPIANHETLIPKEKSCAKKEITDLDVKLCKQVFERFAPMYVWEFKDNEQLVLLLKKILITKPDLQNETQLADAFLSLIQKLPEYWRTKKFTIPNLCHNYNEIVSEIRASNPNVKGKKQTPTYKPTVSRPPEIKREPTAEEKLKMRKDFIKSICEIHEKYVNTGEYGFLPLWVMYDTLVDEKVLKLSDKKVAHYKSLAIATRKAELQKPKHVHEARTFNSILENFETEINTGNEKNRIETNIKTLAVKELFENLKNKQIDIRTLFKQ